MRLIRHPWFTLVLLWAAWACLILGFQTLVDARVQPDRPDYVLEWTGDFTGRTSQRSIPYLSEPFMNRQVSMDSEYYLSIAVAGYDDPDGRAVETREQGNIPLNYAFFPLYPTLTGALAVPLGVLGLTPIATATLAGVIVSLLGTLGGVLALYDLARDQFQDAGGMRAAFYLLAFPSGFFLAQVFTEGLFIGLAFGCLALARRKQLLLAGGLGLLATWTRSVGLALVLPLAVAWLSTLKLPEDLQSFRTLHRQRLTTLVVSGLAVTLPVVAYLIWRQRFGATFELVEDQWFGRALFDFDRALTGWRYAFEQIAQPEVPARRVYYLLETGAVLLAIGSSLAVLRRYPGVALYGLLALAAGLTTGAPQSLIRYVVTIPAVFLSLAWAGKHPAVDRAWSLASILLLGLLLTLFTWDFWVA